MLVLCVLLMAVGFSRGNYVIFEDCGSSYSLERVKISGCERTVPCYMTVGVPIDVSATYSAGFVSTSLTQDVNIKLNNVQINANVSPTACEATYCPVQTQTSSTYVAKLVLPTNLALNTRGNLNWKVFNEKGVKILCFSIVVQTQSLISDLLKSWKMRNPLVSYNINGLE